MAKSLSKDTILGFEMLVWWYSHKDEQVSQPASLGLFSWVEGSEHYEKIFFKLLRRFLFKEIDGESYNKADSCVLDISALIQDNGKIEDTLHIVSFVNVVLP